MKRLWEQQEGESGKAYQAFCHFRDAGPERELRAIYRQVVGKPDAKQASGQWLTWYTKWRWKERALAWDADQDHIRQDAATKAVAKVAAKVAEKRELTAAKVLEETATIAFSRLTDAAKWDGDTLELIGSDELPDGVAAAIESVEIRHDKDGNPIRKIKLHSKAPALDKLGQHFKLWGKEEAQSQNNNFFLAFLEAAKSGEIEREMQRRGLLPEPAIEAEVVQPADRGER